MKKDLEAPDNIHDRVEKEVGSDKTVQKFMRKHEEDPYMTLKQQAKAEIEIAEQFLETKRLEWRRREKLRNNQTRAKDKVGDTLLFTVQQTVLASLYEDRLAATFIERSDGDVEKAINLSKMYEYDYDIMGRKILDYYWDDDATFYGKGYVEFTGFERDEYCMYPIVENIDPHLYMHEPTAVGVNGLLMRRNMARYHGRYILIDRDMAKKDPKFMNVDSLKEANQINDIMSETYQARSQAYGTNFNTAHEHLDKGNKAEGISWYTMWRGKPVHVIFDSDLHDVVKYQEFEYKKNFMWPVIERSIYPVAHSWYGVSVPDLVEDKQRMRAVIQNLIIEGLKGGLNPRYAYSTKRIKNRTALLKHKTNQYVPIDSENVDGAIAPMNIPNLPVQYADYVLNTLDTAAQKATATPDIQQGVNSQDKRTATELNLVASRVDTRYSLSAKVFGWSEEAFALYWYWMYKDYSSEEIDEKKIRIVTAHGTKWRTLTKSEINMMVDPSVDVESKVVRDAKYQRMQQQLSAYLSQAFAIIPNANRRYGIRKLGLMLGYTKDEIELLIPPTIDERIAEDENLMLNEDKSPEIKVEDNHEVHIEIHMRAADTPATFAHIEMHKKLLVLKKTNPEMFPQPTPEEQAEKQPVDAQGNPQQPNEMQNPANPMLSLMN